ncbi:MAG: MFS transporter, partial [Janthinobacterium lividum]
STALLMLPLQQPPAWIALRVVIGFCYGGLALIIESWLNERATRSARGGIFAAYMTANLVASLAGTLSFTRLDPRGPMPFVVMVAAVVMSIVPVALTRSPVPRPTRPFSIHLGELFAISPSGVSGCFAAGLVSGAVGGLGPTFGLAMGLSTHQVALMLAGSVLGGALSYYPAGRLSDRMDRRFLLLGLSALAIAACALLVLRGATLSPGWLMLTLAAFGFAQYPLYGLCVAFVNDRIRERSFAETASELLLTFAAGTVLGPVAGALAMAHDAANLFVFVAAVLALESAFIVWRLVHFPSPVTCPAKRNETFEAAPNSMSVLKARNRPASTDAAPH